MNYHGKNAISEEYRKEAPCRVAQGGGGGSMEQEVTQQIQSSNTAAVGKRKQDGVFYTPQYERLSTA